MCDLSTGDSNRDSACGLHDADHAAAWIAALVRGNLGLRSCAVAPKLDRMSASEWQRVELLLRNNRFWTLVNHDSLGNAPSSLRVRHQREIARSKLFNLRVLAAIRRVAPAMAENKITALVIKGPLQQERVFGSAFARAATDVDLWVQHADRRAAARVLATKGYVRHADCSSPWWRIFLGEAHYLSSDRGMSEVDLHHKLHQAGLPRPARPDLFFATAVESERFAGTIRIPSAPYAFLITCMAMAKGLIAREPIGHYALEIATVCRSGDDAFREAIWAAARAQHFERLTALAITLSEQAFAIDLRMRQARMAAIDGSTARELVLSPGDRAWSRQRTIWTVGDGIMLGRAGRFLQTYGINIAGQLCRACLHTPFVNRARKRDTKVLERDGPLDSSPNLNSA